MGYNRWDSSDWDNYSAKTKTQTTREIFNASAMKPNLDPKSIKMRESRNSAKNPYATPIILALDVTGSMGIIADHLAREGLGKLVEGILDKKPVTDPHIMVMGVGDVYCDNAPLQVSQFEPDIKIAEQLKDIYLEHGGGNNDSESYTLPWYFAAKKTDIDCVKDGRKGILFTFGDEKCPEVLSAVALRAHLGEKTAKDLTAAELYKMVSEKYDVYHVVIEEGNGVRVMGSDAVHKSWEKVLPKDRIISVKDYKKVPEILVSVMEVHGGKDPASVVAGFSGTTAAVIKDAIKNVKKSDSVLTIMRPLRFKPPKASNG